MTISDVEHAAHVLMLQHKEIEKKLNIYRKGCKIWKMLIFCQGGPGHLYLLKNKVATFAKVEKEEDMILFWKRLSRLMSKINPEPDLIHIMGCYVLGNANGEKVIFNEGPSTPLPRRDRQHAPQCSSAESVRIVGGVLCSLLPPRAAEGLCAWVNILMWHSNGVPVFVCPCHCETV
ncbi:UNVERIFIED_CONTAM: hypothetical protein FKN15_044113 [Acipenser sinensis]